jgi:hypothetical protein
MKRKKLSEHTRMLAEEHSCKEQQRIEYQFRQQAIALAKERLLRAVRWIERDCITWGLVDARHAVAMLDVALTTSVSFGKRK